MSTRRSFLIKSFATAGGLGIAALGSGLPAFSRTKRAGRRNVGTELTPWLTIAPDDTVVVRSANADIGNGTLTQAAMTYVVCGLVAGLISGAVLFYGRRRGAETPGETVP